MNAQRLLALTPRARHVLADTLEPVLELDVAAGRAELWDLDHGRSFAVTRVETDARELVICAYAGERACEFLELCLDQCRRQHLRTVRWHTHRPALARLAARFRPRLTEYVFRVDVPGVVEVAA